MSRTGSLSTASSFQPRRSGTAMVGAGSATVAPSDDDDVDLGLALLQSHQATQITDQMIRAAERRLSAALDEARRGRTSSSSLLLRQLATDLGITLSLA